MLDEAGFHDIFKVKDINKIMKAIYKNWNTEQFYAYLERFSIPLNKKIKAFSRGMKMKLAISVALSHEAKLLILDEPTSGLAPMIGTEVEMASIIAANMFSEVLFNVVRENYGSVYSIASQYANSNAPFNLILGYMVSDPQNIVAHIEEAKEIIASGKLISGRDATTGEFAYSTIDERLEGYKNKLLNSIFYESQTNTDVASSLVSSLFKYNDTAEYTDFTRKVRAVEAEDIQIVFNKYWVTDNFQWFAITGSGEESLFNF